MRTGGEAHATRRHGGRARWPRLRSSRSMRRRWVAGTDRPDGPRRSGAVDQRKLRLTRPGPPLTESESRGHIEARPTRGAPPFVRSSRWWWQARSDAAVRPCYRDLGLRCPRRASCAAEGGRRRDPGHQKSPFSRPGPNLDPILLFVIPFRNLFPPPPSNPSPQPARHRHRPVPPSSSPLFRPLPIHPTTTRNRFRPGVTPRPRVTRRRRTRAHTARLASPRQPRVDHRRRRF